MGIVHVNLVPRHSTVIKTSIKIKALISLEEIHTKSEHPSAYRTLSYVG